MSNFGDWLPGAKEGKIRAETVSKRRTSAAAATTDLDLELQDLQVSLQMDQKDYKPGEVAEFQRAVDKVSAILNEIYADVTNIANSPVPERINEMQAYEFMQPALRIESRVAEAHKLLENARQKSKELDKPRQEADGNLANAERLRLQAEIDLVASRQIAADLKTAYAENYPQVGAALLTAESEVQAASQMVASSRLALGRRAWREANDLSKRATTLFESAAGKFQMIQLSKIDYSQAARDADDELAAALRGLTTARKNLAAQATVLAQPPDFYLAAAVQRLGEARRAFKAAPPQYVSALRLAKEARSLLDQGQAQAMNEIYKVRNTRQEAHQALTGLHEAVQNLRLSINAQRAVPVRANECYAKARTERDRLLPRQSEIDTLGLPQLVELAASAKLALQLAQEGLKLVDHD